MALVTLRQLLDHAAERGYGIPAFNITNMETLLGVLAAADQTRSPVIIQASRSAIKYSTPVVMRHMIAAAGELYPDIPVCAHLDHGNSVSTCQSAFPLGFTSVMMDGSLMEDGKTPSDYRYNADVTGVVVDLAHRMGVSVEGELGCLGSLETGEGEAEDGHGFDGKLDEKALLTDADEAAKFVAETGVDALAVACGTSHGAYKFSRPPTGDILSIETIKKINDKLPNTHLVMHGASTVPADLQQLINDHGGEIPETYGVPLSEVEEAIKHGVRKVNIDTDIRMAVNGSARKFLAENKDSFDIRSMLQPGVEATTRLCIERFERFGCVGQAPLIRPVSLGAMADRYVAGILRQKVA